MDAKDFNDIGAVGKATLTRAEVLVGGAAIECAKEDIRFNAVAPGAVETPLHTDDPKDFLKTLQPMGKIAEVKDVVDAVLYLAQAGQVSGEILHVQTPTKSRNAARQKPKKLGPPGFTYVNALAVHRTGRASTWVSNKGASGQWTSNA